MASDTTEVPETNDNSLSMRTFVKGIKLKFPSALNVNTFTAHTWMVQSRDGSRDRDLMFLDCRDEEEYNVSHIAGAIRVDGEVNDLQQTQNRIQEKMGETSTELDVVCYCSLGYRSSNYAHQLGRAFKADKRITVYNMEGSLFKWANEGRPIVDNDGQPISKVHPYNTVFGKLLNSDIRLNATSNSSL